MRTIKRKTANGKTFKFKKKNQRGKPLYYTTRPELNAPDGTDQPVNGRVFKTQERGIQEFQKLVERAAGNRKDSVTTVGTMTGEDNSKDPFWMP